MRHHPLDELGYRFQAALSRLNASLYEAVGNHRQAWLCRHRGERLDRRAAGVQS